MSTNKTAAGAWAWDKGSEDSHFADNKWEKFDWRKAAEGYKKYLQETYGHMRVIGTATPIPIDDIYTDVFVSEKPQAYRHFDMAKLPDAQSEPKKPDDEKRIPGLKVILLRKGHRLFILGKPGAGKTTFLKYLVHHSMVAGELDKLPIFITTREWDAQNTKLVDFITNQFEICNFPDASLFTEYLLESGRAILLFDGLDEVPQAEGQRDKTIQALHDFSYTYLKTQIVIASREVASGNSFTEFTHIEMADFSKGQIKSYVGNWFRENKKIAKDFLKELNHPENKSARDLGRSPFSLSLLCQAYQETQSIPRRQVELYEQVLDTLLNKWDSNRKTKGAKSTNNSHWAKNTACSRK